MSSALKDTSIVLSVSGVSFLNSFFSGGITSTLPTVQRDLSISATNLQWSVALYSLVLGAFLLPAGRLADVYSPRTLFLLGTTFYCLVSVAIALAPSWQIFAGASALLGLGAAANTPAGVGVLGSYFEAGEAKNRAFACLGAGQPLGFIFGLVVGALLTQSKAGWRACFFVQAGLAALFVVIGYFTIPATFTPTPPTPPTPSDATNDIPLATLDEDGRSVKSLRFDLSDNKRVDWVGTVLSVSGLVLLTFALADAQSEPRGWSTPFLPPLIPLAFMILTSFFLWERRLDRSLDAYYALSDHGPNDRPPPPPLLPPKIWSAPHIGYILAIVFGAWAGFNTTSYYLNLTLQLVFNLSPIKTALYFVPMIISGIVLNLVPGFLLARIDGKVLMVASMAMSLAGPILLAVIDIHAPYWAYIFPIMIFTPGPDLSYTIATVQISKSVSRSEQATAGALFNVVTRLATSISLSLISTLANSVSSTYLDSHDGLAADDPEVLLVGYRIAAWMCVACTAVALVLCLVGLRGMGMVGRKDEDEDEDKGRGAGEDGVAIGSVTTRRRRAKHDEE